MTESVHEILETESFRVREMLRSGQEIALLDVREEAQFATGHPLWAANFPMSVLELDARQRIPRRDVAIVVYGEGNLAAIAVERLQGLGYTSVTLLAGGLDAWIESGGELFIDVNVPSKAFGELVESTRRTPSLDAPDVQKLLDENADVVVVDARRFDEYHTMSIPTATSVPGGELVLRIRELATDPSTYVIVNCAGRTRSIIGAQSLINAGLPNPVAALRNGTIGWILADQKLDHGATAGPPRNVDSAHHEQAVAGAQEIAHRAGVGRVRYSEIDMLAARDTRTVYRLDVRTAEEFTRGHLPGFSHAPGGQLVQETDHWVPVRGAVIVLADDDGVRASMAASWLAQMGWAVWVVDDATDADFSEQDAPGIGVPVLPPVDLVNPSDLIRWASGGDVVVLDVSKKRLYSSGHVPGAWWVSRADLLSNAVVVPAAERYVVIGPTLAESSLAAADLGRVVDGSISVLDGGTEGWRKAGYSLSSQEDRLLSEPRDRYRRPYEGIDNAGETMNAYLEWEVGLVEQLERDGTHGFVVV